MIHTEMFLLTLSGIINGIGIFLFILLLILIIGTSLYISHNNSKGYIDSRRMGNKYIKSHRKTNVILNIMIKTLHTNRVMIIMLLMRQGKININTLQKNKINNVLSMANKYSIWDAKNIAKSTIKYLDAKDIKNIQKSLN